MLDVIEELMHKGVELHKSGKVEVAAQLYSVVLKEHPEHPDANHNMGVLAVDIGKIPEALRFFETALEANADVAQFWVSYIDALIGAGRMGDAQAVLDQAKSNGAQGEGFDQLEQRLNVVSQEPLETGVTASKAHQDQPNILETLKLDQALRLAKKTAKEGSPEEAKRIYQNILVKFPKNKRAVDGLKGLARGPVGKTSKVQEPLLDQQQSIINLYSQGQLQQALERAEVLIQQFPNSSFLHNISGVVYKELGQLEEAIEAYSKALAIVPENAEVYSNIGNAFNDQGKLEEAIEAYNKALAIKPDYAEAYYNMGNALKDQGKLEEAIEAYNKALIIKPDDAEAYSNMGNALKYQGKLEEAIEAHNRALSLNPDCAEAYNNMGAALADQDKLEAAIEAYSEALAIKPDYAEAYNNMGNALKDQGKLEEAIEAYNKALIIKPDDETARAQKLYQQAHICDWDSIAKDIERFPRLGTIKKEVVPFSLLPLEDTPARHRLRSKIFAVTKHSQRPIIGQVKPSQQPRRIRLGYFSADFKEHPVAYLIAKMLEQHDRDQFEVFGYSLHGSQQTDMRQRLLKSFDSFADMRGMGDRAVALQAREDGIDIAVDLTGYTQNARTGIFAYRAAPIQINYLGYPGTIGADFMDYIVADRFLIPEKNQKYFNEKPLYLPNTYMPTDNTRELSQKPMSRSEIGLPEDAFVFCCFNNNYKISSAEFDIWMRLLSKIAGSVLWLRKSNEISHLNMKKEAEKRNVDPSRLVFADRAPMDEHLARQKLADLFVDTFAFNAHTTATEALWAGLPVVTKAGEGFAARVAGSLLNAIGLPELVTTTEQDYEELILELAINPNELARVNDKLANNRLTQPLFNTKLYTKHLENGYQQAYQNYFDGNTPKTITVPG